VKKLALFLLLTLVAAGIIGGLFWQRSQSQTHRLELARAGLGTRQTGELLEHLEQEYPDNAEIQFLHGRQLRLAGRDEEAATCLTHAAELGWPRARIDRELLLLGAERKFLRVEPALQKLLEADPDDRDLLLALSRGWSQHHNFAKAEALANALLQKDPADGEALCIRGRIRLQKGQLQEALPDLQKAVNEGADRYYHADACLLLGNCLLDLGRFQEAFRSFQDCAREEPDNDKAYLGMGRCHWHLGRWQEAAEDFRQVLRRQPENLDALSQLAYIHEERGEWVDSLQLLEKALKADPTWYELSFRLARVHRVLGQNEKALEYEKRAEAVKKHWTKPRPNPSETPRNPYTGEDPRWPPGGGKQEE
jgi:tetratricopeptide (TPR) repeat protein